MLRGLVVSLLIGFAAVGPIVTTALIGKSRKPYTPVDAILSMFLAAATIVAILWVAS